MKTTITKMLAVLGIATIIAVTPSCKKGDTGAQGPQGNQGNSGPAALYQDNDAVYSAITTNNYFSFAGTLQASDIIIVYVNTDMTTKNWVPLPYKGNILTSGGNYSFDLSYSIGVYGVTVYNKIAPAPAQIISFRMVLIHTTKMKMKPITDYSYNTIATQFNLPKQ